MGRPGGASLKEPKALVTKRVRQLVGEAHSGNIHEASKITGVPSATLRALYIGDNVNPSLRTLTALGEPYDLRPGWFTDELDQRTAPAKGYTFQEREQLKDGRVWTGPGIFIPWSSWPLPDVFNRLYRHVAAQKPSKKRPILDEFLIENWLDEIDARFKVAQYLMRPLHDMEADFLNAKEANDARAMVTAARAAQMRHLGLFWQEALGPILDS